MGTNVKAIGLRIRREREKVKITREQLAEAIDMSVYYVGQIERGERQMSVPTLIKVCRLFRVSADYILFGEYNPRKDILMLLDDCTSEQIDFINDFLRQLIPRLK